MIVKHFGGILSRLGRVKETNAETIPLDSFIHRAWHSSNGWTNLDLREGRYILDMAQATDEELSMLTAVLNM